MPTPSQLAWADCSAVEQDPQRVSGAWVFRGTRIPVVALFQNIEDGVSLLEFVELFPGVSLDQAHQVLDCVRIPLKKHRGFSRSERPNVWS